MQRRHGQVIDPRSSKFLPQWDMLTALALLYVALFTPYEVAFVSHSDVLFFVATSPP